MLGPNQGINVVIGIVAACQTANCLDCKANYQTCISCNTGNGYYLHATTCKNVSVLGKNQGINYALGIIVACQSTNCLNCKANHQICIGCDTSSGFFLDGTICKSQAMLSAHQGLNLATQTISSCHSSGCTECKANHLICSQCDGSQGYTLQNASCTRPCVDAYCLHH